MGLFPFPFILYTFSPTYCIHSVTTLTPHMRRSHLRDHLQKLRSSWPYNGTSFLFFSVFWLFPLQMMLVPSFVLNYISASICSITLCPYTSCAGLSSVILHTLRVTPLPSTLLHVKTALSCDPECLDIDCKRNSWSAIPPEERLPPRVQRFVLSLHSQQLA